MKTGRNKIQHVYCVLTATHKASASKVMSVDSLAKAIWTSQISVSPPSPSYWRCVAVWISL